MSRSNKRRLNDILAALAAIDRAEAVGRRHAANDALPGVVLAAIQFRVFTIGEAVKGPPDKLTGQRLDVPRSDVARMRDLTVHDHYELDVIIVRATIGELLDRPGACARRRRRRRRRPARQDLTPSARPLETR